MNSMIIIKFDKMQAYKTNIKSDVNGTLLLKNLPFEKDQELEVIILTNRKLKEKQSYQRKTKISKLKRSFGTILSSNIIEDDLLRRENIYGA